jgi:chromosome segregation ATPase
VSDQQNLYTLAEASRLTGLSTEALRLRIKRGKLNSEKGNDGQPRVRLTNADLEAFQQTKKRSDTATSTLIRQDSTRTSDLKVLGDVVGKLGDAVGLLREQLTKAEAQTVAERARANAAEAEAATQRSRADRAEGELEGLKLGTEHMHDHLAQTTRQRDEAQHQLAEAKAAAEAMKRVKDEAEAALVRLRARGLLARLRNRP